MLRKKRLQNKIAASRFSLPVTATLAALVWVAVGFIMDNIWAQFAFTIISTLLMVELNNRNSLMRTYSRMVSCSFLVLITMASLPNPSMKASIGTMRSARLASTYAPVWNSAEIPDSWIIVKVSLKMLPDLKPGIRIWRQGIFTRLKNHSNVESPMP